MKKITLILAFLALNLTIFAQAPRPFPAGLPTCLEDDFRELEKFYDATGGNTWTNKTGWFSADLNAWYGIKLTADKCDVKSIQLNQNKLQGNLIELILPKLDTFNCTLNNLTGSIPNFSNLPNLKYLNCSSNKLSGNIPNFSNLPSLTEFHCNFNLLTGSIPDFSSLPNLVKLNCYYNELSGSIPNFSNLVNLTELYCSNNQLTGTIPDFSNLPNLKYLNFSSNNLTGTIPDFTNLPNLTYLGCSNIIQLSSFLPNFSNLPNLVTFNCQYNPLIKGTIPNFSNLPNLEVLKLFGNSLTGSITNFSNCQKLKILDLGGNKLTGNLPDFSNLPNLTEFNCSNNQLTGTIPNFSNLQNLELLALGNCQLTGTIPNFSNLPNLKILRLPSNQLTGTIPNFSNLPKLEGLELQVNKLTDTIPNFNLPELKEIRLMDNKLTFCPDFTWLPKLVVLDIGDNELNHNIPKFSNCKKLVLIMLNNNKLTGTIPDFTGLNNLVSVLLNDNKLYGNISIQIPLTFKYLGIVNNYFNFGNIEQSTITNLNQLYYSPQSTKLPLTYINNKLIADLAGSNLTKLTYKWFRNNTFLATTPNFNEYIPNKTGKYYYAVNHSILTKLTLLSDTIAIGAKLKGKVFFDVNNNCNLENTEKGRKEILISFQSAQDTVTTVTDSFGNYEVALDTFNYQIVVKTGSLWKTCSLPNIKFSSWSDSMTLNIPMQIKIACPENHVNLSTQRLRRCFNNTYTIKYSNRGTIPSLNTYIIVDFDQWLHVLSATKPYTQLAGNQYLFDIGTLGVDEEGIINVTVKVDCDSTVIGQTHCSTAHIYPDSICATTSAWDMSSLQIKSKCELDKATFEVKNIGTSPTSQPRQSIVIEDQIMMLQSPINLGVGETKSYDFFPNGKTVRVQIEQANFHPSGNAFISSAIEGCGGTPTLGMITQFSQNDNENYLDTDCRQNIGAYDPNEKLATPRGYGEKSLIEPNTDIEYQINFQNEGTDTAFTVVLRDTIDQNLDLTTIQLVASSHPYSWTIEDRSTLKVTFNDIHLTTKKQSDSLSQGFLRYRISQKPNLASGIVIKNRAGIYFDFNKPIITNTTIHRIGRNFVLVAVPDVKVSELAVKVFPNPFHNATTFSLDNAENQAFELKIMDNLGRVIYREQTNNGQIQFQNQLNQGIYYYQILQDNKMASGKLMVF